MPVKSVRPHIRLETLESTAVRSTICCTYATLIAAIVLVAITELGYDRKKIPYDMEQCFGEEVLEPGNGCYKLCFDKNGTFQASEWTAIAGNIDPDAGAFAMDLNIDNLNQEIDTEISFASKFFGAPERHKSMSVDNAFKHQCALPQEIPGWSRSFSSQQVSNLRLHCSPDNGCSNVQIFDTSTTSWGRGKGGFRSYLTNTVFQQNITELTSQAEKVTMVLSYRRPSFRAFVIAMRGILALLTFIFAIVWVYYVNSYYHQASPEPNALYDVKRCFRHLEFWSLWLPQRRWVFWMIVALFWWHNPVFVIMQLNGDSGPVASVIAESISSVSWSVVFVTWIMMVDGLRQPDPYRREYPFSFYVPKLVFVFFFCLVTIGMHVVRQPQLISGGTELEIFGIRQTNGTLLKFTVALGVSYILLLGIWLSWFFHSLVKTRRVLNKLPYAQTRFQQLIFRFLVWQTIVVVVFTVFTNAIPLIKWFVQVARTSSGGGSDDGNQSTTARLASMVQNVSEGFQPIGVYLLVTVYAFFLFYCYLPPQSGRPPVTMMEKLEHGVINMLGVVTGAGTDANKRPFSFEDGCWLFDFAWAAYFDPKDTPRVDADSDSTQEGQVKGESEFTESSAGSLDPVPHGFSIEGFIYSRRTDTVAVVFRRTYRVVVAFRGTVSRKNMFTDVKVSLKAAEFSTAGSHALPANIPGVRQVLPLIHRGFWDAYASVKDPLHNILRSALANAGANARLYCTGHSLGGALATITAYDCKDMVGEIRHQFQALGLEQRSSSSRNMFGALRSVWDGVSGSLRRAFSLSPNRSHSLQHTSGSVGPPLAAQLVSSDVGSSSNGYESMERAHIRRSNSTNGDNEKSEDQETFTDDVEAPVEKERRISEAIRNLPDTDSYCGVGLPPQEEEDRTSSAAAAWISGQGGEDEDEENDSYLFVYTFGSPRVGNRTFASHYEKRVPWTFRIATDGDLVTGMPKFCCMYRHVGKHVWMDRSGNIIVDPSFVETTFISKRRTSLNIHGCAGYRQSLLLARILQGMPLSDRLKESLGITDEKEARRQLLGDHASLIMDYEDS